MNRSRIAYGLVSAATLVLVVFLITDYIRFQDHRLETSTDLGRQAGTRVADALDSELSVVAERAEAFAATIWNTRDESRLLERIREESLDLPILLGVTVAYAPGRFQGRELYSPFFNKIRDEFQFIEETYDYTAEDLATAKWYTAVAGPREARWSDPYYGEASKMMLVDYGVPFFDAAGELAGVVDYAITLGDFTRIVDSLSVGESGYGFTFDADGAILTHPDTKYLLQNVFQFRDGKNEEILDKLRNETEGVVQYNSTYTYRLSQFFFRQLESTGWKSVLVFSEDDLLGATDDGRKKAIHIGLAIGALLLTLLLFAFPIDPNNMHRLTWLVVALSLVIVANTVFIWYLNVSTDFSLLNQDQERIVNPSILTNYVDEFNEALHASSQTRYHEVPTGVFIESYELMSFEASLIGRLWMKYPKHLYETAPPAFYLQGVSAIESRGLIREIISEVDYVDHVLVTWRFRATVEQDFSYAQFPFEQNDIRLVIQYPDPSKNILLVPDLPSYLALNPSAQPGLNKEIRVPSSNSISSFFTLETMDHKTTFGNHASRNGHPALVFNVAVKRIFLSPFISNMIPILIVALILFIVLSISSRGDGGRSGLTTMTVVQSSAGFIFILLLAHVNERNRIQTPEIAYIELFYFSMYLLISLQTVALALSLAGVNWKIFEDRDNRALKLAFWPILLSTWLGFTLVRFY